MRTIDPSRDVVTEDHDISMTHIEPEAVAPVAFIEAAILLAAAGGIVWAVLWLLS